MINLVMINTPKAVATETRKALRKLPNLESALNNLSSLKGVGTTMATGTLFSFSSMAKQIDILRERTVCFMLCGFICCILS